MAFAKKAIRISLLHFDTFFILLKTIRIRFILFSIFFSVCTCTDRIFFLLPRINSMFLTIFRDPPISLMFLRRKSHSNQKTIWFVKFRNNSRDSIFSREYLYFRISLIISSLITISLHVKIISTSFVRKKKLVQNHVTRIYT